jgi:hypothetical protein
VQQNGSYTTGNTTTIGLYAMIQTTTTTCPTFDDDDIMSTAPFTFAISLPLTLLSLLLVILSSLIIERRKETIV